MEFVNPNDPRAAEILDFKEKIMDSLIELTKEHNVSAEVLFNSLISVLVLLASIAVNGDKDQLVRIANELRYAIIGQLDDLSKPNRLN